MANLTETPERTTRRQGYSASDQPRERVGIGRALPARRGIRRPPSRRLVSLAVAVSVLAHIFLLWTVRVPTSGTPRPETELRVDLDPVVTARPETTSPPEAPVDGIEEPTAIAEEPPARPRIVETPDVPIARPRPSERAPDGRTIPPTTLGIPLTPLEATPGGVGRRTTPADARRTAILRAESLLASRLADLPGAGVPEEPSIGLAEGGVTIPVPWGGFIPENRKAEVWREERCSGRTDDDADKPGEREARRSQCD